MDKGFYCCSASPIILIFIISFVVGFLISSSFFEKQISDLPIKRYSSLDNFLYITCNNLVVFSILMSGLLLFKIPTCISLLSNGFSLGFFFGTIDHSQIITVSFSVFLHGFIELFGLFIGAYIGFLNISSIKKNIRGYFLLMIFGVVLIIIAGYIEVYITPLYYNKFIINN